MKKLEELCELDLLCLIHRASKILWERTSFVNEDDYEPWDSSDQTHFFNKWSNDLCDESLQWLWDRNGFDSENSVGEFLIKEKRNECGLRD